MPALAGAWPGQPPGGVSQLAIAWMPAQPGVHVAIVGARPAGHVEDSTAAEVVPGADEVAGIERITAGAAQVPGAGPAGVG